MGSQIFKLFGTIGVNGLEGVSKGLKSLDGQLKQADKALVKFGRQSVKIGTNLTKNITAPIVAAGAAIGFATLKTGQYADSLLDLTEITGLSTDSLQEYENVARTAGVEFDGFVNIITKFSNSLPEIRKGVGPAAEAVEKLGINIFDASGEVRNMEELFPELLQKLREMPNTIERNALAQDLFGRSLKDIAPILGMTAEQMAASQKEAHDLGLVMSGDALNAANEYRISVLKLQAQFTVLWRKLSVDVIPIIRDTFLPMIQNNLIPAMQKAASFVKDIADRFNALDPATKRNIIAMIAFVAAAGPAVLIMGKMILAMKSIIVTIALVRTAFVGLSIAMVSNPFTAIIAAAGLAVAALIGVKMAMIEVEVQAKKRDQITGLVKGIEGLQKQYWQLSLDANTAAERTEKMQGAIDDLVGSAEELGFTFDETKGSQYEQLKALGLVLIKTRDLTKATKEFNALKAKTSATGGAPPVGPSQKEIDEAEKLISDYTKKSSDLTNSRLDSLNDERTEFIKNFNSMAATAEQKMRAVTAFNNYYALEREKIIDEETGKSSEAAQRAQDERYAIDVEYGRRLLEQSGDKEAILQAEKKEAVRIAEEKGANVAAVTAYYDKEIQDAKDEDDRKEKDRTWGIVSDAINAFAYLGQGISDIFRMATDNKMMELDNWEAAERAAIENSVGSEQEKKDRFAALDKQAAEKQRELRKRAAEENKKAAIFDTIMGTASAVVSALGAQPWTPLNFIMAGIIGAIGAAKVAMIAAQPIPFAEGGLVQGGQGGVNALIGEKGQSELVMPMETGVDMLTRKMRETFAGMFNPAGGMALAGAGGAGGSYETHYHIGTLIGDDRGYKELERRMLPFRVNEAQRKGQA